MRWIKRARRKRATRTDTPFPTPIPFYGIAGLGPLATLNR